MPRRAIPGVRHMSFCESGAVHLVDLLRERHLAEKLVDAALDARAAVAAEARIRILGRHRAVRRPRRRLQHAARQVARRRRDVAGSAERAGRRVVPARRDDPVARARAAALERPHQLGRVAARHAGVHGPRRRTRLAPLDVAQPAHRRAPRLQRDGRRAAVRHGTARGGEREQVLGLGAVGRTQAGAQTRHRRHPGTAARGTDLGDLGVGTRVLDEATRAGCRRVAAAARRRVREAVDAVVACGPARARRQAGQRAREELAARGRDGGLTPPLGYARARGGRHRQQQARDQRGSAHHAPRRRAHTSTANASTGASIPRSGTPPTGRR